MGAVRFNWGGVNTTYHQRYYSNTAFLSLHVISTLWKSESQHPLYNLRLLYSSTAFITCRLYTTQLRAQFDF